MWNSEDKIGFYHNWLWNILKCFTLLVQFPDKASKQIWPSKSTTLQKDSHYALMSQVTKNIQLKFFMNHRFNFSQVKTMSVSQFVNDLQVHTLAESKLNLLNLPGAKSSSHFRTGSPMISLPHTFLCIYLQFLPVGDLTRQLFSVLPKVIQCNRETEYDP